MLISLLNLDFGRCSDRGKLLGKLAGSGARKPIRSFTAAESCSFAVGASNTPSSTLHGLLTNHLAGSDVSPSAAPGRSAEPVPDVGATSSPCEWDLPRLTPGFGAGGKHPSLLNPRAIRRIAGKQAPIASNLRL